jgi:hypothetical protein
MSLVKWSYVIGAAAISLIVVFAVIANSDFSTVDEMRFIQWVTLICMVLIVVCLIAISDYLSEINETQRKLNKIMYDIADYLEEISKKKGR